jgi:hypothetical protein
VALKTMIFTSRRARPKTPSVDHVIEVAEKYFKEATRLTGRPYAPFVYEGDPKADQSDHRDGQRLRDR